MRLESALDHIHARAVENLWLRLFTAMNRGLLAIGFIHAGLRKTGGEPFAPGIPADTPIGYYFDAFWKTGEYYWFVGAAQVLAGALLLFPRTATLGAVFYFPIILNIFVLTLSLQFGGTSVVAGFMLLACTYLPPKVIWLRVGSCSVTENAALLRERYIAIHRFLKDREAAFLALS